jgi:hypothetical protein
VVGSVDLWQRGACGGACQQRRGQQRARWVGEAGRSLSSGTSNQRPTRLRTR